MIIGELNDLKMVRKSDLGFMLTDGEEDVLLHFREATKELEEGEEVKVFLYLDKVGRKCATMNLPNMTISQHGFAEVVDVKSFGVYINNNSAKDVLISKDNLPYDEACWPIIGDVILGKLKIKGDKMLSKPMNRDEIQYINSEVHYSKQEMVEGYVCRITPSGVAVVTKDYKYVFVPLKLSRGVYRLGQAVEVMITSEHDFEYYGSLIDVKEKMVDSDAEMILNYLKYHDNKMNLTAKSSAEEILATFKISRKAFKRALGTLYKEKKIDCLETETILIESKE